MTFIGDIFLEILLPDLKPKGFKKGATIYCVGNELYGKPPVDDFVLPIIGEAYTIRHIDVYWKETGNECRVHLEELRNSTYQHPLISRPQEPAYPVRFFETKERI